MDEGIPHLVKMHDKYGKDGLVVLTVTLDEDVEATPEERARNRAKIGKYLTKKKLPFATYDLDFDPKKPPQALSFRDGVPRLFVFNRDNQYTLRLPVVNEKREVLKEVEPEPIEKAIAEAVKKK
jgi:hypothetical protein